MLRVHKGKSFSAPLLWRNLISIITVHRSINECMSIITMVLYIIILTDIIISPEVGPTLETITATQ